MFIELCSQGCDVHPACWTAAGRHCVVCLFVVREKGCVTGVSMTLGSFAK